MPTRRQLLAQLDRNPTNWIHVRVVLERPTPRQLYNALVALWRGGIFAALAHGACLRAGDVTQLVAFEGVQLGELADVRILRSIVELQVDDLVLRRCSGSSHLIGEPALLKAG